jgi:hypothetical protein
MFFLLLGVPFASALLPSGGPLRWLPVRLFFFMLFGLPSSFLLPLALIYICVQFRGSFFDFLFYLLACLPCLPPCLA